MGEQFRLRVCYLGRADGETQYLPSMPIEAMDEAEALRTASAVADFAVTELALKVLVLVEGSGRDDVRAEIIRPAE